MQPGYRDELVKVRALRGTGSMREKRPGVWEVRIVVATLPTVQRSFTVPGDRLAAETARDELTAEFGVERSVAITGAATLSVGELVQRYVEAPHLWKPATITSHRSVTRFLISDVPLANQRLVGLTPGVVVGAIGRWKEEGATDPTISARWLVLRGVVSWAVSEGLLRRNPLLGMRGPPRPEPRRHLSLDEVRLLLASAQDLVDDARARVEALVPRNGNARRDLFVAAQALLMVRVAADTGARRGELAGLRISDIDGRVLRIERGVSGGVVGSTKTKRSRRITIGATTAAMIAAHVREFPGLGEGDWLFSPDASRSTFARPDRLSHRFDRVKLEANLPGASLHRFRHGVATFLVGKGKIMAAQYRLGHGHVGTTLRHYTHSVALEDLDIADDIDTMLNAPAVRRTIRDGSPVVGRPLASAK